MRALCLAAALLLPAGLPPLAHAMEDYPAAQLKALDKSTARASTFDVQVGSTIQYGSLYIKVQACRKADPMDKPESAAFLQIWELPPEENESRWVFSGWMFASSPALSAMDHPVYDVWVLNCTGKEELPPEPEEEGAAPASDPAADNSAAGNPAADDSANGDGAAAPDEGDAREQPEAAEEEILLD